MFSLQVLKKPSFYFSQKVIDNISYSISNTIKKKQNWVINIVFLDPQDIQYFNMKYRKKDAVTDVLSFHYHENYDMLHDEDLAWEIILCEALIISQGTNYNIGAEKEFYKLIIHSLIHILWYDHETDEQYKTMRQIEETIWNDVCK